MRNSKERNKLIVLGGVGEKNFGGHYRRGNIIHDSNGIAATITASPVGSMGGQTVPYLVRSKYDEGNSRNRLH